MEVIENNTEQFEKLIRPWRAAAAIGFVWLVLQMGLLIAEYRELLGEEPDFLSSLMADESDESDVTVPASNVRPRPDACRRRYPFW